MVRSLVSGVVIGLTLTTGAALAAGGPEAGGAPEYVGNGGAQGAQVGGFNQFWNRCHVDFHRNNAWPEPFRTWDKASIRNSYCIMTDNGWKLQNTVGTFLFDSETQRVNQAGEVLVKWIVTQAPINRRAVFVLKGDTAEATSARVDSVQQVVAKYSSGCVYPVLLTDTEPAGWPAAYIDSITQQFNATIPAPRLPARQGAGGGGSGQGGGGASGGGGGTQ